MSKPQTYSKQNNFKVKWEHIPILSHTHMTILSLRHLLFNSQRSFRSLFDNITRSFKPNNIHIASLLISRLTSHPIVPQKKLTIQHISPVIEIRSLASHSDIYSLSNSLYLLASFIH